MVPSCSRQTKFQVSLTRRPRSFLLTRKQVGGEFVFAPSASDPKQLEPIYVHRMENTRGHAPLRLVMQAAGLNVDDVGHDDEAGTTSQAGPSS